MPVHSRASTMTRGESVRSRSPGSVFRNVTRRLAKRGEARRQLSRVRPVGAPHSPEASADEAISHMAGKDVQVDVKDLLTRDGTICQEEVDPLASEG